MTIDAGNPAPEAAPATPAATPAPSAAPSPAPADPAPATPAASAPATPADPAPAVPQTFPDDWRPKLAAIGKDGAEDKALANMLARYTSPVEFARAFKSLNDMKSRGELKNPLPDDASPEQVAQWRKENGIPDAPDKYEVKLSDGLVMGEAEKPVIDEILKVAHGENLKPAAVNKIIDTYYQLQDQARTAQFEAAQALAAESVETLRAEWGQEFKANTNGLKNWMNTLPDGVGDMLLHAQYNGAPLMDHAPVLKALVGIMREQNPMHTVVAAGVSNPSKAIDDEIADIEKSMKTDIQAYWKDPKKQSRYGELLAVKEKMAARG